MKYGMLIYKMYKYPKKTYNKIHNKGLNKPNNKGHNKGPH